MEKKKGLRIKVLRVPSWTTFCHESRPHRALHNTLKNNNRQPSVTREREAEDKKSAKGGTNFQYTEAFFNHLKQDFN